MWQRAHTYMSKYDGLVKKSKGRLGAAEKKLVREWFQIRSSSYNAGRKPPIWAYILTQAPEFNEEVYGFFHSAPQIDRFFFFGKIPTWRIEYSDTLYVSPPSLHSLPSSLFAYHSLLVVFIVETQVPDECPRRACPSFLHQHRVCPALLLAYHEKVAV